MQSAEHRWLSRDGLSLSARDYAGRSDRLPVVCIPGLTRNARDFEDLAPRIVDVSGRRVVALDLRGRGASDHDPNPKNYKPATYANDVLALMASLKLKRAIFIGTSLGGFVTMTLAAKRLSVIGAAVLNDIGPRVETVGLDRIASYAGKTPSISDWADAAAYAKHTNGLAFPDFQDEDWDRFAHRIFNQRADGGPTPSYDPNVFQPVSKLAALLAVPLVWGAFRRLARHRPVLVIRGELSDILSETTVQKMRRGAKAFSYAEVPKVGHAPTLSEAAAQDAIHEFLAAAP